jgi:hypothetical protein
MSIREAIDRFRELHQEFKGGTFKSPEARAFYETERNEFMSALVRAQQLTLRQNQSPRQVLRIAALEKLTLQVGARQERTITIDIGAAGFAAQIGPLAPRIVCDFELSIGPDPVKGRARVVASAREGTEFRTSFAIDTMADDHRTRLEVYVIDAVLRTFPT